MPVNSPFLRIPAQSRNWYHGGFRKERLDIFGVLHERLINTLAEPLRSKLTKVPVGGLFTSDVSAYVASSSSGEPAVIVPWNLYFYVYLGSHFLFRYLDMFLKYTGGEDLARDRKVEEACDEALQLLTQTAADCCDVGPRLLRMPSLLVSGLLGFGREVGDLLKEQPTSDGAIIAHAAMYFVLLHELGHIALGHLTSQHYLPVTCESGQNLVLYTTTTVQEEEADLFAIRHFLTSAMDLIPGPDYLKLCGPCFVFALYRFREVVFEKWRGFVRDSLQKDHFAYKIQEKRLADGNIVRLWMPDRGHGEYVELPVHPPTRDRLMRVTEECVQYTKTSKSTDWHMPVTQAVLSVLGNLIEGICDQIRDEGAADVIAKNSAKKMAEKIIGGRTDSIFPI